MSRKSRKYIPQQYFTVLLWNLFLYWTEPLVTDLDTPLLPEYFFQRCKSVQIYRNWRTVTHEISNRVTVNILVHNIGKLQDSSDEPFIENNVSLRLNRAIAENSFTQKLLLLYAQDSLHYTDSHAYLLYILMWRHSARRCYGRFGSGWWLVTSLIQVRINKFWWGLV